MGATTMSSSPRVSSSRAHAMLTPCLQLASHSIPAWAGLPGPTERTCCLAPTPPPPPSKATTIHPNNIPKECPLTGRQQDLPAGMRTSTRRPPGQGRVHGWHVQVSKLHTHLLGGSRWSMCACAARAFWHKPRAHLLRPGLEAADGDDTAVVRVVLAQAPAVVVRRVEVELLALGDGCALARLRQAKKKIWYSPSSSSRERTKPTLTRTIMPS